MESIDVKIRLPDLKPKPVTEILCLFCRKKSENKFTKINDKSEILNALKLLGVEYAPLPNLDDHICYQCVYRMNFTVDYRRIVQRNIHKSRANYFFNQGNKDMCKKFLKNIKKEMITTSTTFNEESATFSSRNGFVMTGENLDLSRTDSDLYFDYFSDIHPPNSAQNSNEMCESPSKLLEPLYEASESVLVTESGGQINDYNTGASMKSYDMTYKCTYCPKVYKRQSFLMKHLRKHSNKERRKSANSKVPEQFECHLCDQKFSTKHQLKSHEKCHVTRFECADCLGQYVLPADLKWHLAVCKGKKRAEEEINDMPSHHTRSQSQSNVVNSRSFYDYEDDGADSMYSERLRNCETWVDKAPSEFTEEDETKSLLSSCSFATSFSRHTAFTEESDDTYASSYMTETSGSAIEGIKDRMKPDGKLVSSKSSLYLRPKTRSVSAQIRKIHRELEDKTTNRSRGRKSGRKNKGNSNEIIYHCPECNFTSYSLHGIMKHDANHHSKLLLFHCDICRQRFTRDEFLQRHVSANHASVPYKCPLCEELLIFKHELKHHLELHQIRSHSCDVCQMSFLKENQLAEHYSEAKHIYNKDKKKIEIISRCNYLSFDDQSEHDETLYKTKDRIQSNNVPRRLRNYDNYSWKVGDIDYRKLAFLEAQNATRMLENSIKYYDACPNEEQTQPTIVVNENLEESHQDIVEESEQNHNSVPENLSYEHFELFSLESLERQPSSESDPSVRSGIRKPRKSDSICKLILPDASSTDTFLPPYESDDNFFGDYDNSNVPKHLRLSVGYDGPAAS